MEAGLGRPSAENPREDPRARLFAASVTLIVTGKGPFFAYFRATEEKKISRPGNRTLSAPVFGGGLDGGGRGKRTRPGANAPGRGYAIYW